MIGMRETKTIGEWMDLIQEWEVACQHGDAYSACELCAGALRPVTLAIGRHLVTLFDTRHTQINTSNKNEVFNAVFQHINEIEALATYNTILQSSHHPNASATETTEQQPSHGRENLENTNDVAVLHAMKTTISKLIEAFTPGYPNIKQHPISVAVRENYLYSS